MPDPTTIQPSSGGAFRALLHERLFLFIMLANIAYFVVMLASGVNWQSPLTRDLLNWGGNYAPFTLIGQSWRLVSSMFMHAGVIHLALNMLMLFQLGMIAEQRFGSLRFGVVYWLSGLGGALLSALWNSIHEVGGSGFVLGALVQAQHLSPAVSVGASGAIMGLAGALFVSHYVGPIDDDGPNHDVRTIGQVILMNLAIGFMVKGIDQSAHIGGLLGGLIGGLLLTRNRFGRDTTFMYLAYPLLIAALATAGVFWVATQPPSEKLQVYREQVDSELRASPTPAPDPDDAASAPP